MHTPQVKSRRPPPTKGGIWPLVITLSVLYVFGVWQAWLLDRSAAIDQLKEEGAYELNLYVQNLMGTLEKYQFLPQVVSSDGLLANYLKSGPSPDEIAGLNHYLERVNQIVDASDTYLMNAEGLTVAASNWASPRTFVGQNFSYRPYFQEAMQGRLGRYFALGTTSLKRGYYFAYPVEDEGKVLGAVVVKINLSDLEAQWGRKSRDVLVSDDDGVIFITTRPQWQFFTHHKLTDADRTRIRQSQRYTDAALESIPLERTYFPETDSKIWRIRDDLGEFPQTVSYTEYLVQERAMEEAGWNILLLTPLSEVDERSFGVLVTAGLTLLAIVLGWSMIHQRNRRKQERRRFEEKTRETLRRANDELELRVEHRTADLKREIGERMRTEAALRQTQDELIHAAKLATLGQMSTGISHELNQPLSAIRSFTDNARMLLDHDRPADARQNLVWIAELTDRMAQISSQLKQYARKTSGEMIRVSLEDVVTATLHILRPRLKTHPTEVELALPATPVYVLADAVQLEQVFVNIATNAIQAMKDQDDRRINISAQAEPAMLRVSICDNGPGIAADKIGEIFEPFFTTRETGLGLGLSISKRIIESMGGSLEAIRHPGGGAEFILRLQIAPDQRDPGGSQTHGES